MHKLFTKAWIIIGPFVIIFATSILIVFVHITNFLNRRFFSGSGNIKDPFHDSRRHPLSDQGAPRG